MTLTIVGLGPGSVDDLTRRAWRALEHASVVYLRTSQHPCVPYLPAGPDYRSFDEVYESSGDFEHIYTVIVDRVLEAARQASVVYAVPGDPRVAESTVTRLLAAAKGLHIEVISGISFIEPALRLLGIDALDGLQILDALDVAALHHPPINPDYPALLGQVYNRAVASDLKLTLMNQYPDEFEVMLVHRAGATGEGIERLPLYEIDRSARIQHLTALYVPPLGGMSSFERFQETIAHLRAPEGCPWDRQQTHLSLRKYLLEEAYEVLEAIDAEDPAALREELGDLLLQIGLHVQIAVDDGEFHMADVLSTINHKLIRRHPHVWGAVDVDGAEQVVANWEAIKREERSASGEQQRTSLLDGIPKGLPALLQAYEYTARAAKPGFDWPNIDQVVAKVREELEEVLNAPDADARAEEIGDLLFVIVNWARWLNVEPESALRATNAKFHRRFQFIEQAAAAQGRSLSDWSLDEMDALWKQAKAKGL